MSVTSINSPQQLLEVLKASDQHFVTCFSYDLSAITDKVWEQMEGSTKWEDTLIYLQTQGFTVKANENTGYALEPCNPFEYTDPTQISLHEDKTIYCLFL
jgi:hypothetical protein